MISLEDIVAIVVKEVVVELKMRGFQIDDEISESKIFQKKIKVNMSKFKTPLLTEAYIFNIGSEIKEIEVPKKTIITPSAWDLIREKKIVIKKNNFKDII